MRDQSERVPQADPQDAGARMRAIHERRRRGEPGFAFDRFVDGVLAARYEGIYPFEQVTVRVGKETIKFDETESALVKRYRFFSDLSEQPRGLSFDVVQRNFFNKKRHPFIFMRILARDRIRAACSSAIDISVFDFEVATFNLGNAAGFIHIINACAKDEITNNRGCANRLYRTIVDTWHLDGDFRRPPQPPRSLEEFCGSRAP